MITAQTPLRKPQHLIPIDQTAWGWHGLEASLCPTVRGLETSLLIRGGRLPHAKNNSRYARCTLLSSRTRGKFDKHWIVSLCATLMCSLPVSDASLSLVFFPAPLRMQWVGWKNFRQARQCLSCHTLSTASKLFATFVLPPIRSETPSSSSLLAEFVFILEAAISYPSLRMHLEEIIQSCSISLLRFIVIFSLYTKPINSSLFFPFRDDVWLH